MPAPPTRIVPKRLVPCTRLVFGCPKNRTFQEPVDKNVAINFFKKLGRYAASHNTVEDTEERMALMNEFARLLKQGGTRSILKQNRNGRHIQVVVLLNNFSYVQKLLEGRAENPKGLGDTE